MPTTCKKLKDTRTYRKGTENLLAAQASQDSLVHKSISTLSARKKKKKQLFLKKSDSEHIYNSENKADQNIKIIPDEALCYRLFEEHLILYSNSMF